MSRIRTVWAIALGFLIIAGWAYAGEPPAFRETARVTLHHPVSEWESESMAFTNNTWQSVNDGDWNNTSNWNLGVKPGANHIAIFDGTSSISVTTNLDQSASGFEQLLVKPTYGGNIGSQGNPLHVALGTAGVIVWRGRGQGYINPKADRLANVICDVRHGYQENRYDLVIGGAGIGTKGTIAQLGIKRGNVNIMGDINFTAQTYLLGDAARLVLDANLDGVTDPVHVFCAAGTLINKRPLQTNTVLVVGDRSRVTQVAALVVSTHVLVIGNGKFKYLPTSAPGTSPLISIIGGVYDQSDEKWDNVWGTTVIGPDASIIGGAVRGTNFFPASFDLREEYPGAQE